jgi:D-psicose/D-tagatose/L-ribulose 3-epimerase
MKLGVHALVWVGGWTPAEARHAIASTAEAGYDLIEIPLLDPSSVDARDTRGVLDDYGIRAGCSLGLSPETNVSSEDPAAVAAGRRLLADALAATVELGAARRGVVRRAGRGHAPAPAHRAAHPVRQGPRVRPRLGAP